MVALKQGLSLVSTKMLGGWQPSDEGARLTAWYKNKTGISLNGSDVSRWTDSTDNGNHMVQATASEQPAYTSLTGALTFDSSATQNLQTTGTDIELSGTFTIGIKLNIAAAGGVIIGDNTAAGEFFRLHSTTILRIKIDNLTADVQLDSGTWGDGYMVVTRNASNVITLWWNGVQQTTATPTLSGTANIDTIGVRKTDLNPYDGTISEIQIFNAESTAITANVNTYLSNL